MAKANKNTKGVSDELFHAAATLATRLAFIAEHECKIDPVELLVLWHLKHYGKTDSEDRPVMLRHDLTELLGQKFRYSDADVSKLLDALHDEHFIDKEPLTKQERMALFETESNVKLAVRLQPAGSAKIEEFKNILGAKFDEWLAEKSKAVQLAVRKIEPLATDYAQWLLRRYEPTEKK